jgi:hypothetical protein
MKGLTASASPAQFIRLVGTLFYLIRIRLKSWGDQSCALPKRLANNRLELAAAALFA